MGITSFLSVRLKKNLYSSSELAMPFALEA
jgi:hypothetical protein